MKQKLYRLITLTIIGGFTTINAGDIHLVNYTGGRVSYAIYFGGLFCPAYKDGSLENGASVKFSENATCFTDKIVFSVSGQQGQPFYGRNYSGWFWIVPPRNPERGDKYWIDGPKSGPRPMSGSQKWKHGSTKDRKLTKLTKKN